MSDLVFVVLRAGPDAVQTIGPSSEAFASFKQADAFAKEMSNRYPQQTFYVCQTIAVYEVQCRARVKKVATTEITKKRTKLTTNKKKDGPVAPNVYPIRAGERASE